MATSLQPLAEYKDRPESASGSKQNDAEPEDGIRIDGSDVLALRVRM